jgi:hypothetical protein
MVTPGNGANYCTPSKAEMQQYLLTGAHAGAGETRRGAVHEISSLDRIGYLPNSSMIDIDLLPRHLLVLGNGIDLDSDVPTLRQGVTIVKIGPCLIAPGSACLDTAAAFLAREAVTLPFSDRRRRDRNKALLSHSPGRLQRGSLPRSGVVPGFQPA